MTTSIKKNQSRYPFISWGLWLVLLLSCFVPVQAEVELSSGEFYSTTNDLVVKAMGGQIKAQRTWYKGKWEFNRAWNPLDITYDNDTGDVISIKRNNDLYKKSTSGDAYTLEFDKRRTITKTTEGFRWTDRNGKWIDYDANGRILRYGHRNNVTNTLLYDIEGRRSGVQDHFGNQVLWYAYDTDGHLISVRDQEDVAQARQAQYHYTGDLMTSVTDVLGKTWKYTYTSDVLTRIEDPDGQITDTSYGAAGRVSEIKQPDGLVVSHKFDYDKVKKQFYSRRSYSDDRVIELWFNKAGKLIRRDVNGVTVAKGIFDGRRRETTNELGHTTIREYDEWENVIKITYPDTTSRNYKYDTKYSNLLEETDERGIVKKYEYDENGNLIRKTEAVDKPEQRITELTYDEYGNMLTEERLGDAVTEEALTTYTYDDFGNIKSKIVSVSTTESHTTNYDIYDRMGNLKQWRDGRGKIWKQTYDPKGQRISKTDPLNHTYQYEYDNKGNLIRITDPTKNITQYVYSNIRLEKIVNTLDVEKRFVYNDKSQLISIYDEDNHPTFREYDEQGRPSKLIDGTGNAIIQHYGVVASRNVTRNKIAAVDYPTFRQEMDYDVRGRLIRTINILNANTQNVVSSSYDATGNLISVIDAEQKRTRYDFDSLRRRSKIFHPDSTTVIYKYDNRDNLLAVTNENKIEIRRYNYDKKNRKTKEIWPNGETHKYIYDENDNLIEKVDAKGQIKRFQFDDANRLIQIKYFSSASESTPTKTINFSYNTLNALSGYNDGHTSANYIYDDLQRKISETINYGSFSKTISYSYKNNGLKETFTDPSGIVTRYSYDEANKIANIALPGEGNITYNSYQWTSPSMITYPGGSTRNILYDPIMHIQRIVTRDPAKNILFDRQYAYDKVGNITNKITEHGKYVFEYDNRDRLISVDNPTLSDEVYSYDDAGNRLTDTLTPGEWIYNDTNQLVSFTDNSFEYDLNGSRTRKTASGLSTTYIYNLENRLSEVIDNNNSTIATYYYDPFGRRLWKDKNGDRTYYFYTEEGLVAELNSNGSISRAYGYVPHSTYGASILYARTDSGYSYYQTDNLGTPKILISKSGQIQWEARQQSFGIITEIRKLVPNNLRFPGQYNDGEVKLNYNYYRTYDPLIGRYLESDPIDLEGGLNTYLYVNNNPINQIDPDGQLPVMPWPDTRGVGPSGCEYYSEQCDKSSDSCEGPDCYSCAAQKCCESFGDNPASNCTRECLIDVDRSRCSEKTGKERSTCRYRAHVFCYASCLNLKDLLEDPTDKPECQDALNCLE